MWTNNGRNARLAVTLEGLVCGNQVTQNIWVYYYRKDTEPFYHSFMYSLVQFNSIQKCFISLVLKLKTYIMNNESGIYLNG